MSLHKMLRIVLLFIVVVSARNGLKAQDINEHDFVLYTKEQGLSQNTITGIAQDSTGYIWVATASGLNRFNGSQFIQFHSTDDSLSLPEETLKGLVWLDKYRLAVYTGGVHIINTRTGEVKNLFIPYSDNRYLYKFNNIMSVKGDEEGDIFIVARSGFYHYDKAYNLVFRFDYYSAEQVVTTPFGWGGNLLWLDRQHLAIFSSDGIYQYEIGKKQFAKMQPSDYPVLSDLLDFNKLRYQYFQFKPGVFLIMKPDTDSVIYVDVPANKRYSSPLPPGIIKNEFDYRSELTAISDTLFYITGNLSGFFKFRLYPETGRIKFNPKKYFTAYRCRRLMEDRNNNLWIGTSKGLFHQDGRKSLIRLAPVPSAVETLFPKVVLDNVYAAGDKLFAATLGDLGLLEFDKQTMRFNRRISFGKSVKDADNLSALSSIDDNTLLVGTNGPLYQLNLTNHQITEVALKNWEDGDWIADLYKDKKKNIWVTATNVYKYDAITGKFQLIPVDSAMFERIERPNHIAEDASGNIWISGHGLLRYNTLLNKFDRLIDSFPFIKIPDRQVNSFTADEQNNLWINSNNNGLICYDIDKGTFRHFTRDDGLPDNNIAAMIVIGNKLWLASFSGIACMDLKSYRVTNFGKDDGFPDQPIPVGSSFYYEPVAGRLYVDFSNTIACFDPNIIYQKSQAPRLFFESLTTDDRKIIFPGKSITTSWQNDETTITIGAINFVTGSSQRFAYRVVTDDSCPWHQLGEQNTFTLAKMSPGYHRVQVKLYSVNNRWPEQVKEIGITILPPFWNESWFTALSVILLLLLVYLLLKWRTSTIRRKERAKTHIQKLKADEYKNQFELEQISNYFSSSLAGKKNVDDVLWDVAKNLIGRMNFTDCMIYMWNEDKTRMLQKASYGPKGSPVAISNKIFDVLPGQGVVGHVMQTKEPLLLADTRKDSRYRVDDIMRLSELCVPIIHNNELIGIIDSEHHDENHFNERDMKILTTIATLVGNKIKQIESEQSLEIKQKEIAFINQQLAEAQLSALQTQMNPHFIFNSLNSIKGMILADEQQKASRYLSKFAQMIRITLSQSKEIFTTLYENTEHLENYLEMEKLRFDDSFTFTISVDEQIDQEETLIPTLMIQPLAENAIWHGLLSKKGDKKLAIHFSQMNGSICCTIEDNGIGIRRAEELKQANKTTHQSVGLSNLRNRIKIMNEKYHANCSLKITDMQDLDKNKTGTCAMLSFNIITTKSHL